MIKAAGQDQDGKPFVIVGLSSTNMIRLMDDEPILINLEEIGLPDIKVIILGGDTEEMIAQRLVEKGVIPEEVLKRGL